MKRMGLLIVLVGLTSGQSLAGLRLGLGDAAAKRSAELINKAGAQDPANATGAAVSPTLPACGNGAIYTTLPTDLSQILAIEPMGSHAPPPHTFPSDHFNLYAVTTTVVTPALYAPATIHITDIASTEYLNANPVFFDYQIYFYVCSNVETYFGHVRTLSALLLSQTGPIDQNCFTYTTGGTFRRCDKPMNVVVQEGELLGYAATSGAFDFGSYDDRVTLSFVSPSRHPANQNHIVCPTDYFTPGLKAAMEGLMGRFDGELHRTVSPVCGTITDDIPNTASGDWYHVGSPDGPEDPHLFVGPDNVAPTKQLFSVGTSVSNLSPATYTFIPASAGHINRDVSQVTADATIYCYDTFYDPIGQLLGSGMIFLVQMPTPTSLTFESQPAASCGAGPWTFSSNAVNFQR